MAKSNDYDEYLKTLHSKQETPEEIIKDFVKEGTGKEIISKKRIIAGEVNEVYDVTLNDKTNVILRISPNGSPDFQQEKWAVTECKKVGVPVPEIFLVKYQTIKGKEFGLCLMEKIDGEPLERGGINFHKLSLGQQNNYIYQAGEILSKIHSISTFGWGWIIKNKGQYENSDNLFLNWLNKKELYEKAAKEENLELSIINKALRVMEVFRKRYSIVRPCLNHGDYSHKHFMVKNGKIVGVLDWGGVGSDSPIYDFANWDYWFGEAIPTEWLKEGYANKNLFDKNFEDFLYFIRISRGLENLKHYHEHQYEGVVEKIKIKLIKDLMFFK